MKATRTTKEYVYYYFVCEACRAEGKLKVPIRFHGLMFECPECGACYVQWFDPIAKKYDMKCVVMSIFEESPEAT
jgi:hypothetical protein